ncbi:hypothetical protein STEG23_000174 [Scotinomys teguina]
MDMDIKSHTEDGWQPQQQQQLLFLLFLIMYLATVLGNLLIILAIGTDSCLHTPMYFFLSNLSFVDVCFSSTIVPKMTHKLCVLLVFGPWVVASLNALLHTLLMAQLSFCADNIIPHFFCDTPPLLNLSCSDTHPNELMILFVGGLLLIAPFACILVSYVLIACAILRVSSTSGRWKAFSTCSSHLAVVCLFYGTIISLYFNPSSSHSAGSDMAGAVMYTVVTPMLNPFIYSLRNKDMKGALRKVLTMKFSSIQ